MSSVSRANKFVLFLLLYQIAVSFLLTKLNLGDIFNQLIYMLVPILFYFFVSHRKINELFLLKPIRKKNVGLLILFALVVQPVMSFFSLVSTFISKNYVGNLIPIIFSKPLWLVFILYAIFPAVFEELIFRGIVFSEYKHIEFKKAIFINGIIFGAMHLNFQQFLYAFIMGVIFCVLVYYTQSIFASIIVHFIFNGTQIIIGYISYNNVLVPIKNFLILLDGNFFVYLIFLLAFLPISVYIFYLLIKNCEIVEDEKRLDKKFFTLPLIIFLAFSFFVMLLN